MKEAGGEGGEGGEDGREGGRKGEREGERMHMGTQTHIKLPTSSIYIFTLRR